MKSTKTVAVDAAQGPGSPCEPGAELFGHVLLKLARNWRRVLDRGLAEQGLTDATWVPLFHLHAAGDGISLKALAHRVSLDSSTLVRVVDLLEARGLVERVTDAADRRSKRLWLTAAGHDAIADVRGKLERMDAQLLAGTDPAAMSALKLGMADLSHRLAQMAGQGVPPLDEESLP